MKITGITKEKCGLILIAVAVAVFLTGLGGQGFSEESMRRAQPGSHGYDEFQSSDRCAVCHKDIYNQYRNSAMAKAMAAPWDQAEYFQLALPHTLIEDRVTPVEAGCINCHAPQAFLAGDIPPPRAGEANPKADGVSCHMCHSIVGFEGEAPFNGNFVVRPGNVMFGSRKDSEPMGHETEYSSFFKSAGLCGICHDETSPYGAWVKETYREWRKSPYSEAGVSCIDCHLPSASGKSSIMSKDRPDVARHLFQGAHSPGMLNGAATLHMHVLESQIRAGRKIDLSVIIANSRAGHYIPTGSTEERQLWLRVEAVDADGKTYHIPAPLAEGDTPEKSYSVTTNRPAYMDLGMMMGLSGFKGIARDALPEGDRLFRKVFLNPDGEETIAQWYTVDTDVFDNRLKPFHAVEERYLWTIPENFARGTATITATLNYRRLPQSVADLVEIGEVPILHVAADKVIIEVK